MGRQRLKKEIVEMVMTSEKSLRSPLLVLLVTLVVVATQTHMAVSQDCTGQLTNLLQCEPFIVPGNSQIPNASCCNAINAVDHTCICNTLRVISSLPSQCHLPSLNCPSNP